MNDYCNGIAYATGYFAKEKGKQFLFVRNVDSWYADTIGNETGYKIYKSNNRWCVKARNVSSIPALQDICNTNDFCRAYIEIHGILDLATVKSRKGVYSKKPRLRIYGSEEVISCINKWLPAKDKKIQYISNIVDEKYIGRTCSLYYQSTAEIECILKWLKGYPMNKNIWNKWYEIIDVK